MFHTSVVESDAFLDLPVSSQALYFHLGMHADDDGFINGPKQIARSVGCNLTDLQNLIESNFLLQFDDVVVIRHWRVANCLKNDRIKMPRYPEISKKIFLRADKIYTVTRPSKIKSLWTERKNLLATRSLAVKDGEYLESSGNPDSDFLDDHGIPRREEKKGKEKKRIEKKREEPSVEEGGVPADAGGDGDLDSELKFMGGKLGKGVVLLSDAQIEDLLDKLGLDGFDHYVEKLAAFILKNDAKVKNHYATILRWWQEDRGVTYENQSFEEKSLRGVQQSVLPGTV